MSRPDSSFLIHYRPVGYKILSGSWSTFLPIFAMPIASALIICSVAVVLAPIAMLHQEGVRYIECIAAFTMFAGLAILLVSLTMLSGDDRIVVTKEGLTFPLFLAPWLGCRRHLEWKEIATIDYDAKGRLNILMNSGKRLILHRNGFANEGLENFIIACDVFSSSLADSTKLLRQTLKKENLAIGAISFTQIWNDELSLRFQSTAFVPLDPGRTLQNQSLKIVRQLAFGGLAAIYLAQRKNNELVVVKEAVIPPDADDERKQKALEMFQRESRLLAGLDHPQIAKVYDAFVEDNRHYLILEFVSGMNLRQLVQEKGVQSEQQVLIWAKEIAGILKYLHSCVPPILHRDLTPENLIVTWENKIVLVDFGAANEFVGTMTGTVVGKQSYIAPEQFRGKPCPASDIYGLGGTIHFLLTGENPKPLRSSNPRLLNEKVSEPIAALVERCTHAQAEHRHVSAESLERDLETLMDSRTSK